MQCAECSVCSVQCVICRVQLAVYKGQCAVLNMQYTLYSVQCAMCSVQCRLYFNISPKKAKTYLGKVSIRDLHGRMFLILVLTMH